MEFIKDLKEKEYREFWRQTPNAHFMQSYEWGQVQKKSRDLIPCYIGLKDNDKLVAAALLLKKRTPLNMCYFYVPRGFTLDYNNNEVVEEFTKHLKNYLKEENAIYLKIDPPLMYQEIDEEANPIKGGMNNYDVYEEFIKLGYKHKGFNKLYEGNQPRYTFRTYYKQFSDFSEVEKTFSKSFSKPLKRSYDYDLEIYEADEVKTFYDLIQIISKRDGFKSYTYEYYNNVFTELKKDNLIKVFNAKINPSKLIKKFEEQVKNDHNEDRKKRTLKDIEFLKNLPNQKEYTCASLICTYSNGGAWSLYIGNDEAAAYTGTVNRLYYEFMKDAFENQYEYADLFGVVGDPHTKFKNLAGIFEYKRKIGGDFIEFIGEFDLINKPFWYKVLPILLKIYRKLKK